MQQFTAECVISLFLFCCFCCGVVAKQLQHPPHLDWILPHSIQYHAADVSAADATDPITVASTWTFTLYENITCDPVGPHRESKTYTTGECVSQGQGHGSAMYYCDEDHSYIVLFQDVWCKDLTSIRRADYQCQIWSDGAGDFYTYEFGCKNPAVGPALPYEFPPPQSTITSACVNNSLSGGYVCPNAPDAICVDFAVIANKCQMPTPGQSGLSTIHFCTETESGMYAGIAEYSDTQCTNLIATQLTLVGCIADFGTNSGVTCNGAAELNQTLPQIGTSTSAPSSSNCSSSPQLLSLVVPGACYAGNILSCPNGNTSAELTYIQYAYNDLNCQHAPINQVAQPVGCAGNTNTFCSGGF